MIRSIASFWKGRARQNMLYVPASNTILSVGRVKAFRGQGMWGHRVDESFFEIRYRKGTMQPTGEINLDRG